jgi:hypothetical protein
LRYACACSDGFSGTHCQTDICETDDPCGAHGSCVHGGGGATQSVSCMCEHGFSGEHCGLDVCQSHPCLHGGSCTATAAGGFTCACQSGFGGDACDHDVCAAANDACGVHGTCQPAALGSFHCVCASGWQGPKCDTDINECLQTPAVCLNSGTCVNTDGSFTCECHDQWFGTTCQLDYCKYGSSAYCQNGGVLPGCTDPHLPHAWDCACADGFTGRQCEKIA